MLPDEPLPLKKSMFFFTAALYHKEQKKTKAEIQCGNCLGKEHIRKDCKNEAVCYACHNPCHKKGSMVCTAFAIQDTVKVTQDEKDESENERGEDDYEDVGEGKDDANESETEAENVIETENETHADTGKTLGNNLKNLKVHKILKKALSLTRNIRNYHMQCCPQLGER